MPILSSHDEIKAANVDHAPNDGDDGKGVVDGEAAARQEAILDVDDKKSGALSLGVDCAENTKQANEDASDRGFAKHRL